MQRRAILIVFLAVALSACGGKKRVVTEPHVPELAPPPPPERVVVQQPTGESGDQPGAAKEKQKPADKDSSGNASARAPKPAPAPPPPPVEAPPPPAPEQKNQPLQMADSAGVAQARELLNQAGNLRDKAAKMALSADARQQYEVALGFIAQAQKAIADNNPTLAVRLAKNAVTILSALVNR